jgi:hypothetical protein
MLLLGETVESCQSLAQRVSAISLQPPEFLALLPSLTKQPHDHLHSTDFFDFLERTVAIRSSNSFYLVALSDFLDQFVGPEHPYLTLCGARVRASE